LRVKLSRQGKGLLRGILVFGVTYALVASRRLRFARLDRAAAALVGAVLAVALGAITPDEASRAVDHTTIILLFAVMGMGTFLSLDGFFERAGMLVVAKVKTRARLVGAVVWGAGILSAIVTNDAVCVLCAPLVVGWIDRYKLPRLPLLLALATGANTGSVATLVGNPQNMLCGSLGRLAFSTFSTHLVPVAIVGLAINHGLLLLFYRRELREDLPHETPPARLFTVPSAITLAVILVTVVVYTAGGSLSFTALAGFAVLLVVNRASATTAGGGEASGGRVWEKIDWSVLVFFGALFVAVDAFARSGAATWAFDRYPVLPGHETNLIGWMHASAIFLVGSNVVTNVPFILIVREEMDKLPDPKLGWELLAMASTFAGNLTLLGSVANVIVAEKAQRLGGLRFGEYLRFGAPLAVTTTLVGAVILVLLH
jgi:Na+/H+ antiporter NhaD/arsenite permease-like protein